MSVVWGADADALDAAAVQLEQAADQFDVSAGQLGSTLGGLRWLGNIAVSFSDVWNSRHRPGLARTAGFLRENAATLRRQAADQRRASNSDGTTSASGWGPAPLPPSGVSPGGVIEARFEQYEQSVADYLSGLPADDPLRKAIEGRLAQGYRIYYADLARGHIVWSTGNLATAINVVVTVPGTGTTVQSLTEGDLSQVGGNYVGPDTAVLTTLVWTPPPTLLHNVALSAYQQSLADGPMAEILTSLHETGRGVVVTGHSAGGAALQTLFERHPELASTVDGVVLLAPAEYHPEFAAVMGDVPIAVIVHSDDPILLAHADEIPAIIRTGLAPNVTFISENSGTSLVGGVPGLIENAAQGNVANGHDQSVYAKNHADVITGMFPGSEQLDNGMVRQRFVDSDGSVQYVDTGTF